MFLLSPRLTKLQTNMVDTGVLNRSQVIQYVGENAPQYGLDPAAVLSVANHEGLNQAPGSTWNLTGEGGFNFGPPSWYTGTAAHPGAGRAIVGMQGSNAPNWSWTPAGLDYWLTQVSKAASGLTGGAAIQAIVNGFEHPREDLAAGEINNAQNDYSSFQQALQGIGSGGGNAIVSPSQPPATDTTTANPTAASGGGGNATNLDLGGSIQHTVMQFILVMLGIALLLGGIYLIGSGKV